VARDYKKEKEARESYNYCKECSKRVMKAELIIVEGIIYHDKCWNKLDAIASKKKALQSGRDNDEYIARLRKQRGLK